MSEGMFKIFQEFHGAASVIVRGAFLALLVTAFIRKDSFDKRKAVIFSVIITAEGLAVYAVPFSTRGMWNVIGILTTAGIFIFYDKRLLPHFMFIYFLWQNIFYDWFLVNAGVSEYITQWLINGIDYSALNYAKVLYGRLAALLVFETMILTLAYSISLIIIKRLCAQKYDMSWTEALFLSVYSAVSYIMANLIAEVMVVPMEKEVFVLLDEKSGLRLLLPLLGILIFVGELAAIATWQRYRRLKEEDMLHLGEIKSYEYLKRRLEYVERYHDEIRGLRHDMAGKLTVLKSLIAGGRYSDAEEFLGELGAELNAGGLIYSTGNPVADAVINEAAALAKKAECSFECNMSFAASAESGLRLDGGEISAVDIGVVLSNLFDNALEAVKKLPQDKRFIRLSGGYSNENFYLINMENSFDGVLIKDAAGNLLTRKTGDESADVSEHGIGLKSVKYIAEKYLGGVDITAENNVFTVKVMLQTSIHYK